jgi:DNA-3-methyladenine glycosylase II
VFLGQQVTVGGATTLAGRLVKTFGQPVEGLQPLGLTHVFPSAAAISDAGTPELRGIGIPTARAEALREFARAYLEERIRLDPAVPLHEATEALQTLPGVGPWTAQMIAYRAMGQRDAFAAGDLGLRRNAARLLDESAPLDPARLEQLAEAWRPHRALAALHLWMAG